MSEPTTLREKVFAALNVESITSQLSVDADGRCIYHTHAPDAGTYPILIYSIISDVPALTADNAERERRVTVRVHICTTDGTSDSIYRAVNAAMLGAGFMRVQCNEVFVDGIFALACDYRVGCDVNF